MARIPLDMLDPPDRRRSPREAPRRGGVTQPAMGTGSLRDVWTPDMRMQFLELARAEQQGRDRIQRDLMKKCRMGDMSACRRLKEMQMRGEAFWGSRYGRVPGQRGPSVRSGSFGRGY
jgi:hypothetical protein